MDKINRLSEIIDYYANGKSSVFAAKLGVSPQAISTWKARGTYDTELIFTKCENINPEWLLTGRGSMLLKDKADNIVVSGSNNKNINTNINSTSQVKNSPRSTDNKAEIEVNTQRVKIEFLEQMLIEKDKMLSEKDKMIAEKERYIVLLEQQLSKQ